MICVNTGNGKGKTTASVGQAIRALGQEQTVAFGQFMKRDNQAGEQYMLHKLLGELFFAPGDGFLTKPEQYPAHRATSEKILWWAKERLLEVDMLILDEALYALSADLIKREELEELIAIARNNNTHLVLSGRNAPQWLIDEADLVTEMTEIKHHYKAGIPAQKGIEF